MLVSSPVSDFLREKKNKSLTNRILIVKAMRKAVLLCVFFVISALCCSAQGGMQRLRECWWTNSQTGESESLRVVDGMAPVLIVSSGRSEKRYVVPETKVRELERELDKKIAGAKHYVDLSGSGEFPLYSIHLRYDGGREYVAQWDVEKPVKDVRDILRCLRDRFAVLAKSSLPAPGMPAGALREYYHRLPLDPQATTNGSACSFDLNRTTGKRRLKVLSGRADAPYVEVDDSVFRRVGEYIREGCLYETDKVYMPEWQKRSPAASQSSEAILMGFDGGKVITSSILIPTDRHREYVEKIDRYISAVYARLSVRIPEGRLIYCSCSRTNHGLPVGEVQRSYYELLADEGKAPRVVYCEDRGSERTQKEYPATPGDVRALYELLREKNVQLLDGYHEDERMTGGTTYRVYMEFSGGGKLNATWCTHSPDRLALDVYNTILRHLSAVTRREDMK